jgi:hypothetical protein
MTGNSHIKNRMFWLLTVAASVIALLFVLQWLGREQPTHIKEIRVQPQKTEAGLQN